MIEQQPYGVILGAWASQRSPGLPALLYHCSTITSFQVKCLLNVQRLYCIQGPPPAAAGAHLPMYKTKLCQPFMMSGECARGDQCSFAHGPQELRNGGPPGGPPLGGFPPVSLATRQRNLRSQYCLHSCLQTTCSSLERLYNGKIWLCNDHLI